METTIKPRIGAVLRVRILAEHRDWLLAGQRDMELQDPAGAPLFDGDWKALAKQARGLLADYMERIGIHGSFIGISLAAGFDKLFRNTALAFGQEIVAEYMVIRSL